MSHIPTILIGTGVALVLVSFVWPLFVTYRPAWTDEQATQLTRAAVALHNAESLGESRDRSASKTDPNSGRQNDAALEQARQQYQRNRAAFDDARMRGDYPARLLRWIGVAVVCAGLALFWASSRASSGSSPH